MAFQVLDNVELLPKTWQNHFLIPPDAFRNSLKGKRPVRFIDSRIGKRHIDERLDDAANHDRNTAMLVTS
jgi:hypothetical protein